MAPRSTKKQQEERPSPTTRSSEIRTTPRRSTAARIPSRVKKDEEEDFGISYSQLFEKEEKTSPARKKSPTKTAERQNTITKWGLGGEEDDEEEDDDDDFDDDEEGITRNARGQKSSLGTSTTRRGNSTPYTTFRSEGLSRGNETEFKRTTPTKTKKTTATTKSTTTTKNTSRTTQPTPTAKKTTSTTTRGKGKK